MRIVDILLCSKLMNIDEMTWCIQWLYSHTNRPQHCARWLVMKRCVGVDCKNQLMGQDTETRAMRIRCELWKILESITQSFLIQCELEIIFHSSWLKTSQGGPSQPQSGNTATARSSLRLFARNQKKVLQSHRRQVKRSRLSSDKCEHRRKGYWSRR